MIKGLRSNNIYGSGPRGIIEHRWTEFQKGNTVRMNDYYYSELLPLPKYTLFDRPIGVQPGGLFSDIWIHHILPYLSVLDLFSMMKVCKSFQSAAHGMIMKREPSHKTTMAVHVYYTFSLEELKRLAIKYGINLFNVKYHAHTKENVFSFINKEVGCINHLIVRKQAKDRELVFEEEYYGTRVAELNERGFPVTRAPHSGRLTLRPTAIDTLAEHLFVDGLKMKRSLGKYINHKTNLVDVHIRPVERAMMESLIETKYSLGGIVGKERQQKQFCDMGNHVAIKIIRELFDRGHVTLEWVKDVTAQIFVFPDKKRPVWILADRNGFIFQRDPPDGNEWIDFLVDDVRVFVRREMKKRWFD